MPALRRARRIGHDVIVFHVIATTAPCAVTPSLELDQQRRSASDAASRAMTRANAPVLAPSGLTYPQYLTTLARWSADEALTVGERRVFVSVMPAGERPPDDVVGVPVMRSERTGRNLDESIAVPRVLDHLDQAATG
jgi:hypothetical protein